MLVAMECEDTSLFCGSSMEHIWFNIMILDLPMRLFLLTQHFNLNLKQSIFNTWNQFHMCTLWAHIINE